MSTIWSLHLQSAITRGKSALKAHIWGGVYGVVRHTSQNPYPIYDQNVRYSPPYLRPDQKFEALFMTWPLNQNPVSDLHYN